VTAGIVYAWSVFGDQLTFIPGAVPFHGGASQYALYVVIFLAALAVFQIFRMLTKGKPKIDREYAESAERVRLLQDERRLLQEKLKSLSE
jgi:ABC-type transport system involved in cytochrome bd biosynthesis fused ATPase/permease subunit